jgi:nitrate/TMAO reductase-like tetraheme cytochrome c subunit
LAENDSPQSKTGEGRRGLVSRLLGLLGIELGSQGSQFIVLTRRFPFVLMGIGVLGLLAFGGFTYYTSTSGFCNSCHYMEPYYSSWQHSSHKMVPCEKCHYAPGVAGFVKAKLGGLTEVIKTVTHTEGPMPHAEVDDASCLREGCHETRLLQGRVLFKEKYHFDHTPHLTDLRRGKQLHCTSCHSQIVQGSHIAVTESVCFICHFKGEVHERYLNPIAGCTACHQMPQQQIQINDLLSFQHKDFVDRGVQCWKCHFDSIQGVGDVPRQVCQDCHNRAEDFAQYADTTLMHEQHVNLHKVECFLCHTEIRHGLSPQPYPTRDSCATCHTNHTLQEDLFHGIGPDGQAVTPSAHSQAQVDCVACHEFPMGDHGKPGPGMVTYEVNENACMQCHGPAIKGLLGTWQAGLKDMQQQAEQGLAEAAKTVDALPEGSAPREDAQAALDQARHNLDYVEKAYGVHNPEYAFDLLDQVSALISKAARAAGAGPKQQAAPAQPKGEGG